MKVVLAAPTITILVLLLSGCGLCGNEILSESLSPDGSKRAVLFSRDCGATTDYSWQISILGAKEVLPDDGGNAFAAGTDHGAVQEMKIEVDWKDSEHLIVSYPEHAHVFHHLTLVSGVRISYEKMKHAPSHGV
jgi:hypothetical protein